MQLRRPPCRGQTAMRWRASWHRLPAPPIATGCCRRQIHLLRRKDTGVRMRPTPVLLPAANRGAVAKHLALLLRPRRAVVPFNAAPASLVESDPVPQRLSRGDPWICGASTSCTGSMRCPAGQLEAEVSRAEAERPARRTWFLARALPASTVRHHGVRGHPLVRPGLIWLWPVQRHDSWAAHDHSGGVLDLGRVPASAAARTCASGDRLEGVFGVITRNCGCGCTGFRRITAWSFPDFAAGLRRAPSPNRHRKPHRQFGSLTEAEAS